MKWAILCLVASSVALSHLPRGARAGCNPVVIRKQAIVSYQQFYTPFAYTYAVGQQLQVESQEERIANLVVQKLQAQQQQVPQTMRQSPPDRWSLVRQNCVKCHTETNEKAIAALYMGDLDALDWESRLAMIRMVLDGKMPKNKPLDPAVIGNLLGQIANAETAPGYTPQVQPGRLQLEYPAEQAPPPPEPQATNQPVPNGEIQ